MVNMSAKFDKETLNGGVSIVFHARTEPQQRYYIPHRNALSGDNNTSSHMLLDH